MRKLRGLRYLPGGANRYIDTLMKALNFINKEKPAIEQFKRWFSENFPQVKGERAVNGYVLVLEDQLALIEKKEGRFKLTPDGAKFSKTQNVSLLFKMMTNRISGFDDILKLLLAKPFDFSEIDSALRSRFGWKTPTQTRIRLGWLQSMGYVTKIDQVYSLTDSGRAAAQLVEVKVEEVRPYERPEVEEKGIAVPSHNEIKDILYEIGKFEGWVSETEYPIDSYRLDVAWKRIRAGNPSYVFEVQISGNFFEALTKLKHSWDKWNAKPFLVTSEKYEAEAKQLLAGSFHEIEQVAKIVNWKKVRDLYEVEKKLRDLKSEIGLS